MANVADEAQVSAAIEQVLGHYGRIDILVNNAGITQPIKTLDIKRDNYDAVLDVSLRGTLLMSQAVLPAMRALDAAEKLRKDNVSVAVLHVPTIKPLDEKTILEQAARPGRLVLTAENHTQPGGLGEAVAALLMRNKVWRISMPSACPTLSWMPAPCRPCMTVTASPPPAWWRESNSVWGNLPIFLPPLRRGFSFPPIP